MTTAVLSDKALAVFAFALYHQLSSGDPVTGVVAEDGSGHKADPEAVMELEAAGLARLEAGRIVFTDEGHSTLAGLLKAMKAGR